MTFIPTHRIRCAPGLKPPSGSSNFVGRIIDTRIHESNGLYMFRLEFPNPLHQQLWAGAWFYMDDLEPIQ